MAALAAVPGNAVGGTRELSALTSRLEKRVLVWLAERTPRAVSPDHLTGLGLAAMVVAGLAYAGAGYDVRWLHVVNVCLLLNWLGDSLDGTLARVRQRLRPRYGFYVDHFVDAIGALCVTGGLALSGLMSPALAAGLLIAYYLLSIHIYLATQTQGVFKISYGLVGGTELRLILAGLNLWVMHGPVLTARGLSAAVFDVAGAGAILILACVTAQAAARTTRELYVLERLDRPTAGVIL